MVHGGDLVGDTSWAPGLHVRGKGRPERDLSRTATAGVRRPHEGTHGTVKDADHFVASFWQVDPPEEVPTIISKNRVGR